MFLFPKDFASESEINSSNIVLRDKNNNRIIIPLRSSISWDDKDCLISNADEFQKVELSKKDLKSIYDQFNSMIKAEKISSKVNHNHNDFNFESYFKNQDIELQMLLEKSMKDASVLEKQGASAKIPTLEVLMSTNNYIIRTEQEILSNFKNSNIDIETEKQTSEYDKLPLILRDETIEFDLCNIKKFADAFKAIRLKIDMSQKEVTNSMEVFMNRKYDQSTICRFEGSGLNLRNMKELIVYFRRWLKKVFETGIDEVKKSLKKRQKKQLILSDNANMDGVIEEDENSANIEDCEKSANNDDEEMITNENVIHRKNRARRTTFTEEQLKRLDNLFQTVKLTQVTSKVHEKYSQELGLTVKQIRTWLCKKRRIMRVEEAIKQKKARK